ncbi:MAG: hypothetical protein IJD30_05100, partial [Clostridia bacterium]|nr:hypothetical protein [Clostridia bacterium]
MRKNLQNLIAGLLIGATLSGGAVFAKQATEKISVIYDNIKIIIDGKEYQPTNAKGETVEPFIYEGTTYLPVRAIANAFDKEVDWEAQTSTVTLGSKNYDWLDQMGYADYEASMPENVINTIPSQTRAYDEMLFDRGLSFQLSYGSYDDGILKMNDGTMLCYQEVSYLLNGNYKSFSGTLCTLDVDKPTDGREQHIIIKVYGDGSLIYTSPVLSSG